MNFHLLKLHIPLLVWALVLPMLTLLLSSSIGEPKPVGDIEWTDVLGEGGICLLTLVWIFFTLISRPAGKVTLLLVWGLLFMHVSLLVDLLDEFFRYPERHSWLSAGESLPAPIGMLLLSVGLYHWHREQLTVNKQLQKRERIYREHGLIDFITGLYSAEYMFSQIKQEISQQQSGGDGFCLMMLDVDQFDAVVQQQGDKAADKLLRTLAEVLLLHIRPNDLACRYAGDRFIVLLPNTTLALAEKLAEHALSAVQKTPLVLGENVSYQCRMSVSLCNGDGSSEVEQLLGQLNQQMERVKQSKHHLAA